MEPDKTTVPLPGDYPQVVKPEEKLGLKDILKDTISFEEAEKTIRAFYPNCEIVIGTSEDVKSFTLVRTRSMPSGIDVRVSLEIFETRIKVKQKELWDLEDNLATTILKAHIMGTGGDHRYLPLKEALRKWLVKEKQYFKLPVPPPPSKHGIAPQWVDGQYIPSL